MGCTVTEELPWTAAPPCFSSIYLNHAWLLCFLLHGLPTLVSIATVRPIFTGEEAPKPVVQLQLEMIGLHTNTCYLNEESMLLPVWTRVCLFRPIPDNCTYWAAIGLLWRTRAGFLMPSIVQCLFFILLDAEAYGGLPRKVAYQYVPVQTGNILNIKYGCKSMGGTSCNYSCILYVCVVVVVVVCGGRLLFHLLLFHSEW